MLNTTSLFYKAQRSFRTNQACLKHSSETELVHTVLNSNHVNLPIEQIEYYRPLRRGKFNSTSRSRRPLLFVLKMNRHAVIPRVAFLVKCTRCSPVISQINLYQKRLLGRTSFKGLVVVVLFKGILTLNLDSGYWTIQGTEFPHSYRAPIRSQFSALLCYS